MLFKWGYIGGIKRAILPLFIDLEMIFFQGGHKNVILKKRTQSPRLSDLEDRDQLVLRFWLCVLQSYSSR